MTLMNAFDVSAQGVEAASSRIATHTQNVANAQTPFYVRKIPVIGETSMMHFQGILSDMRNNLFRTGLTYNSSGVMFEGNASDPTPGKRMYVPGHPQADKDGFITMSNVNIVNDMADSIVASKLYEANLSVISVVKQMATKALEIGRGQ